MSSVFYKPVPLPAGPERLPSGKMLFRVWAPRVLRPEVVLLKRGGEQRFAMEAEENGYFRAGIDGVCDRDRYWFALDGEKLRPDPASRYQPEGVHGPSAVVETDRFRWKAKKWKGLALEEYVFYEIHTGTFSDQGTFDSAIAHLDELKHLGVTCVEIMPVAQFPGRRNWGYDGVQLYAPQSSYGGPDGLQRLVDACHLRGLAVCLDVVYNHLGPEGNYLHDYGPYFTDRYHTPWGDAVNYDGAGSDSVREFIISNALYWLSHYRIDALRLDAVHGIFDFSPKHILAELNERVDALATETGRLVHVIAESDLNDVRMIHPRTRKGYGCSAQWADDFHHAVHTTVTGEQGGYYQDYSRIGDIGLALQRGFSYEGRWSHFRSKTFGSSTAGCGNSRFVFCLQNHDQVGNRPGGERISSLVSFEAAKLMALLFLSAPALPLLFMGEEYGEKNPFLYFVDHGDPQLVEAVRKGRREEFAAFGREGYADPKSIRTLRRSKLNRRRAAAGEGRFLKALYRDLLAFRRKGLPAKNVLRKGIRFHADEKNRTLSVSYPLAGRGKRELALFVRFAACGKSEAAAGPGKRESFSGKLLFHTAWKKYGGSLDRRARGREILVREPFAMLFQTGA